MARASGELAQRQQAVESLVKPIGDTLARVTLEITQLEKQRAMTHADLVRLIGTVNDDQRALKSETSNLVRALRRPEVRGRWGELQLRKVVEMAGMLDYVDFVEQASAEGEDGRLRPDMIVRLPGGQQVVVDAKAPLDAYLAAVEAVDGTAGARCWTITPATSRTTCASSGSRTTGASSRPRPSSS